MTADGLQAGSQSTLAYLMTDVAGSTPLWEAKPDAAKRMLPLLDKYVSAVVESAGGRVVKSRGEGDSHFCVFNSVDDAVVAAAGISVALLTDPALGEIRLRSAIHAGAAEDWGGDFYGPIINRCQRIREAAQPGQILLSEVATLLSTKQSGVDFKPLGVHRLRDLMKPERLFQLLHPDLPSGFAPPRTLSSRPHNLPIQLTPFIGRVDDISLLSRAIQGDRLTTVSGAGGVGKTRLSLQAAAECTDSFRDGLWFVDLAQTQRTESVLPIISRVVSPGGEASEEGLVTALESQQALLILDNCEHLYEECRKLARCLLVSCPELSILATSRRILNVPGEHVLKLNGLARPGPNEMDDALSFDAVRLFVETANRRGSNLDLTGQAPAEIARLCEKLDGLPLAIEIAASRTDIYSVTEIARSVADCLRTHHDQGWGDRRQETMAATIEWSCRLLSPDARALLQDMAFFPNTWTLQAAIEVGESAEATPEVVKELISHSLVFSSHVHRDEMRFGLLQTTREVLARQAEASEDLRDRYRVHCRRVAEHAVELMKKGEEAHAYELIDDEWESLIKALDISFEGWPDECASLAMALKSFWSRGTRLPEGRIWLEKLLESPNISPSNRISVLTALSSVCIWLGDNDRAESALLEAEAAVGPDGGYELARIVGNLAVQRNRTGRLSEAKKGFERSVVLFQQFGTPNDVALALLNLGVIKLDLNEPLPECEALFEQALDQAQQTGSPSMQASAHSSLAHVALREGDLERAMEHSRVALRLWQNGPYLVESARALVDLAEILEKTDLLGSSANVLHIAERLEHLSQSPFLPYHRDRLDSLRERLKSRLTPVEWRAGHRLVRSKTGDELLGMALEIADDARPDYSNT